MSKGMGLKVVAEGGDGGAVEFLLTWMRRGAGVCAGHPTQAGEVNKKIDGAE